MGRDLVFEKFACNTYDDDGGRELVADIILHDKNRAASVLLAADSILAKFGEINFSSFVFHYTS